jgi:hypothetical protein
MRAPRDIAAARRIRGQGRILEALAGNDTMLTGTLSQLGRHFGMTPGTLRICLLTLAYAGWITIAPRPRGRLTIRLEQRPRSAPPVTPVRRRPVLDTALQSPPAYVASGSAERSVSSRWREMF